MTRRRPVLDAGRRRILVGGDGPFLTGRPDPTSACSWRTRGWCAGSRLVAGLALDRHVATLRRRVYPLPHEGGREPTVPDWLRNGTTLETRDAVSDTQATDPLPDGVSASPDVTLGELQLAAAEPRPASWKASATT